MEEVNWNGRLKLLFHLPKNKKHILQLFYYFENVFGYSENVFVLFLYLIENFKIKFKKKLTY